MMLACAASVALALALAWRLVSRESLQHTTTAELMALFGLFVLPGASIAAIWMERSRAATEATQSEE